ncbi:peptidylprolyl isomerase [Lysobacter sp. CAU 1642]|uniref:Peptidyl-prolyl cis-trans isomerase n=1 Tax=Pseudomarimonas salicorniae TaxID=2933270 RepID=A0ABT0GFM6_9GAMM|nr:peptidylprolyl isomerase [Lysobacter sp. CAU 1642]
MIRPLLFSTLLAFAPLVLAQTEADPAAGSDAAAAPASAATPQVAINTSLGRMVVELYPEKAPKSVENFLQYVRDGHYNGTIFHRVIDGFMIQGGGFTADLQLKPMRPPIENEARNGLSNQRGTLAMARTGEPHSAQSQFFINVVDNPRLDFVSEQSGFTWGYAVFGKVIEGLDVVDRIRAVETGGQGPFARDVPLQPVVIESAEVLSVAEPPAAEPPAAEPGEAPAEVPAAAATP